VQRRDFLKLGASASVGASVSTSLAGASAPSSCPRLSGSSSAAPAILTSYDELQHRRRLENIALGNRSIRKCLRKHLITDYLPGHCCYNLGEYPAEKIWNPDEWDERELDALQRHGIRLIQVHEEWNDSQRLCGAHKLAAANPAGFKRFVEMVHRRGLKIIVYVSSGYFDRKDPDFRPEWAGKTDLREIYFRYARCSPASPGWRAYFLPRVVRLLDEYGVDGLYNDLGYAQPGVRPEWNSADQVPAFEETPTHDGALEDFLGLLYAEVNRRGGLVKIHRGGPRSPNTDIKIYDYLWVGEGGRDGAALREVAKHHRPYVTPCLDMSRAKVEREDDLYLDSIPYLQFPLLLAGRPFTGERANVPGIEYPPEQKCFWTRHLRAMGRHYQDHPEGPHSYGWWDSCPGRPEARPTHARWLRQYLPLVDEGAWAWLEIADSDLFVGPLPPGVVASAFANREFHLVLANYQRTAAEVLTTEAFRPADQPQAASQRQWKLPARSLSILCRA